MDKEDEMAKKALKAIAEEELSIFINSKNISDDDLKQALLTAMDIDILCDDLDLHKIKNLKEKKEVIKDNQ